jgi:hypothetical protein
MTTGDIHPKVEMTGGEFLFVKKEIEKEGKAAIEKVCEAVAEEFMHLHLKALIEMCREEGEQ